MPRVDQLEHLGEAVPALQLEPGECCSEIGVVLRPVGVLRLEEQHDLGARVGDPSSVNSINSLYGSRIRSSRRQIHVSPSDGSRNTSSRQKPLIGSRTQVWWCVSR